MTDEERVHDALIRATIGDTNRAFMDCRVLAAEVERLRAVVDRLQRRLEARAKSDAVQIATYESENNDLLRQNAALREMLGRVLESDEYEPHWLDIRAEARVLLGS